MSDGQMSEEDQSFAWASIEELTSKLKARVLAQHPHELSELILKVEGDTIIVSGAVGSEAVRSELARQLFSFDGVMKVRNQVIVAGFFEPASDDEEDAFFGGKMVIRKFEQFPAGQFPVAFDNSLPQDVSRFPHFSQSEPATAGRQFELKVDLKVDARGAADQPISLGQMKDGWSEMRIAVQCSATGVTIEPLQPLITVREDGSSEPATFRCAVSADFVAGEQIPMAAVFLHGTRVCGHAHWQVETALETEAEPQKEADRQPVHIDPSAAGPSLTVMIHKSGDNAYQWMWTAALPGATRFGSQSLTIEGAAFSAGLLAACPALDSSKFRRRMNAIGKQIWEAAPQQFRADFVGFREKLGSDFPIQFVSDDPHVPWELMVPDNADHLFIDHPVSRWPLTRVGPLINVIPCGNVLSFVPDYPGNATLPAARREGNWLVTERAATAVNPTRTSFLDVLDGKHPRPVSLVHFAGHGRSDSGQRDAGIRLEDDWVTLDDVSDGTVRLGEICRTFIVLNACEAANQSAVLGMNWGWAERFAALGFTGVLAPLWKVEDDTAGEVLKAFLPALHDNKDTLGKSLRDARRTLADSSVSALAYIAHGDVMARSA